MNGREKVFIRRIQFIRDRIRVFLLPAESGLLVIGVVCLS